MDFGIGTQLVLFALAIGVVVAIAIHQHKLEQERMAAMRRFARMWRLRYKVRDRAFAKQYEPGFKTLRRGTNRYAFNLLRGEHEGRQLAIFDHHYEVKTKDSTSHYHRTMLLMRLDVDLGKIELRPENWGDKVSSAFGFDDIDFESAEFSRRYYVQAGDKRLAYALFHPKMIEYLLRRGKIRLATYGPDILLWRKQHEQLTMLEMRKLIEDTYDILDLVPRYMLKDRSAS